MDERADWPVNYSGTITGRFTAPLIDSSIKELTPDEELEFLARKLHQARAWKSELMDKLDDAAAEEAMIKGRLKELMEKREMTKFHVKDVGLVYFQSTFFPKIKGDIGVLIDWLDSHDGQTVAPRTVSKERLREFIEEALHDDREVPPSSLVEVQSGQDVRFRPDHKARQQG